MPGLRSDFNSLAKEYAEYRTSYSDALFQTILEYAHLPLDGAVLDLACGTGLAMMPYLQHGLRVTGVDIAPAMMEIAQHAVEGRFDVRFCLGRAEELPFPHACFDLISCGQSFHWFDAPLAFAECARVLRPGGAIAIFWKHAARDDPYTLEVEALIREWMGEEAAVRSRDHAAEHEGRWAAFWQAVRAAGSEPSADDDRQFYDGERRVIEFTLSRTVESFTGYQRSREKIRMVMGERRDAFLEELERRLRRIAPPDGRFQQRQIEYLYLARRA